MSFKLRLKKLEINFKELSGDGRIAIFEDLENSEPNAPYIVVPIDPETPKMTINEYYERYGEIDTDKVCGWILEFDGWKENIENLNEQYREWVKNAEIKAN